MSIYNSDDLPNTNKLTGGGSFFAKHWINNQKLERIFELLIQWWNITKSGPTQCDQMAKLFLQYLAHYNNELLPNT